MDLSDEEPGEAMHIKVVVNVCIVNLIEAVAEAHVLAEKTGLKAKSLHSCLSTVFGGPYTIYSERMSSGDYYRSEVSHFDT